MTNKDYMSIDDCIKRCTSSVIINYINDKELLPSVILGLFLYKQYFDNTNYTNTNNPFYILQDDDWNGKVYSLDTRKIYTNKLFVKNEICIKCYPNIEDGLIGFVDYFTDKLSPTNRHNKYIPMNRKYNDALYNLFYKDEYTANNLKIYRDSIYFSKVLNIIEENKLYMYD